VLEHILQISVQYNICSISRINVLMPGTLNFAMMLLWELCQDVLSESKTW
jgi:hypothetical protein